MERFSIMGLFANIESGSTAQLRGPTGVPGPRGNGFKLDARGNFIVDNKKITGLGICTSAKDATNKKYVYDKFLPVNMTRNVFKDGIVMEGGRIEGLPSPGSVSDAVNKLYVDTKFSKFNAYDNIKRFLKAEAAIGTWTGSLKRNGSSVDVGFDTSKATLFTFKFKITRKFLVKLAQ